MVIKAEIPILKSQRETSLPQAVATRLCFPSFNTDFSLSVREFRKFQGYESHEAYVTILPKQKSRQQMINLMSQTREAEKVDVRLLGSSNLSLFQPKALPSIGQILV